MDMNKKRPNNGYAEGGIAGIDSEVVERLRERGFSHDQIEAMANEGTRPTGTRLRALIEEEEEESRRGREVAPVTPRQKPPRGNSKGGKVRNYKKGGTVRSRGDGIARTGKTRGKIC